MRIDGQAGHSGEVSMADRHDALAAAAEVVLAVEAAARAEPAETVATVGTLAVRARRRQRHSRPRGWASTCAASRRGRSPGVDAAIRAAIDEIATRRGVTVELELVRAGEPVTMDAELVQAALAAAHEHGVPAAETWSGAGHDAQHLTALAPALLLFVPLHGGESHTPQEGADMDEIVQAARVVTSVLGARLAAG